NTRHDSHGCVVSDVQAADDSRSNVYNDVYLCHSGCRALGNGFDAHILVIVLGLQRHLVCFFFSSRRRHTRLVSDWSSDVCSSDLSAAYASGWARRPTFSSTTPASTCWSRFSKTIRRCGESWSTSTCSARFIARVRFWRRLRAGASSTSGPTLVAPARAARRSTRRPRAA